MKPRARSPRTTQARRLDLEPVFTTDELPIEGQTLSGGSTLAHFANFVKLPHTVFALPFALLGVVYASHVSPVTWSTIVLVVTAFTAARFAAMGFNRIVDRDQDAMNPRTERRELPTGMLTVRQAGASVVVSSLVFLIAAGLLNRVCLVLAPVALGWILAYSYTKRFSSWSHLWLGVSLAIAPIGGFLAVAGSWSQPWWSLPVLALGVMTWVAGFDIFYALQDVDFDRHHGLKSAVVLLGTERSILVAKVFHGVTILALLGFGAGAGLGPAYFVGIALAAGILAWEHQLVGPDDLSRLDTAFFAMNGVMSIVVFVGTLGDRLL
ncbi:MAG: UbiA family prenyltransferase [Gemmatimonadetes bacterium]|nr:UbiA family prenyltransferase [Gemmatimonadota bacterium]